MGSRVEGLRGTEGLKETGSRVKGLLLAEVNLWEPSATRVDVDELTHIHLLVSRH